MTTVGILSNVLRVPSILSLMISSTLCFEKISHIDRYNKHSVLHLKNILTVLFL